MSSLKKKNHFSPFCFLLCRIERSGGEGGLGPCIYSGTCNKTCPSGRARAARCNSQHGKVNPELIRFSPAVRARCLRTPCCGAPTSSPRIPPRLCRAGRGSGRWGESARFSPKIKLIKSLKLIKK